jgi:membrane protease YdiL (CAAX protease family)
VSASRSDDPGALVIPAPSTTAPTPPPAVPRNTVADTWSWMWKDTAFRIVPFALAGGAYARLSGGARVVGLTRTGWRRDLLVGAALGVPLAGVAAGFRKWVSPGYRLPTVADQGLQSAFYLALNAPVEEVFWRGAVQTLAIQGVGRIPAMRRAAPVCGWLLTTAAFGAYHRLGNWSWRAIAGVTAAGGLFGGAYLATGTRRSILPAVLIHGCMTAGFLSWGDVALHLLARRRRSSARGR